MAETEVVTRFKEFARLRLLAALREVGSAELSKQPTYAEICDSFTAEHGWPKELDWQSAARAASVLQILTRMIEGDAFEARIIALEQAAAGEHGHRATNGRGYYDAHP